MRNALHGVIAGAAGTAMLDVMTYADMAARNRPASELPPKMVDALAQKLHAPLPPENRRTGLGALLGYVDGLGTAALFGLVRPVMREVPWYGVAAVLAVCTMVASEGTATAMKQTDPRTWGFSGWAGDLIPRFVYGAVTCITYDKLAAR